MAQALLAEYIPTSMSTREHGRGLPGLRPRAGGREVGRRLGGAPLAFIHKTRDPLVPNQVVSNRVVGDVDGRTCVLIDDMIDTGGTIAGAVQVLHDAGAEDVIIAATHGVLSDPAAERLADCGAREVMVTNTLPIGPDQRFQQLTVLSIAPLMARAIREVFENGSVTSLFDGRA